MDDDEILEDNSKAFTIDSPEAIDLLNEYICLSTYIKKTEKYIEEYRKRAIEITKTIKLNKSHLSRAEAEYKKHTIIRRASYDSSKKKNKQLPRNVKRHLSVQLISAISNCNNIRETTIKFKNIIKELNDTLNACCSSLNANLELLLYYKRKIQGIELRLKNNHMYILKDNYMYKLSHNHNYQTSSVSEADEFVSESVSHASGYEDDENVDNSRSFSLRRKS